MPNNPTWDETVDTVPSWDESVPLDNITPQMGNERLAVDPTNLELKDSPIGGALSFLGRTYNPLNIPTHFRNAWNYSMAVPSYLAGKVGITPETTYDEAVKFNEETYDPQRLAQQVTPDFKAPMFQGTILGANPDLVQGFVQPAVEMAVDPGNVLMAAATGGTSLVAPQATSYITRMLAGLFGASAMDQAAVEIPRQMGATWDESTPEQRSQMVGSEAFNMLAGPLLARAAVQPIAAKPIGVEMGMDTRPTATDLADITEGERVPPTRQLPEHSSAAEPRFYVTGDMGQTLDASQLTPRELTEALRGPREYVPPVEKKTYQGETPIINQPETLFYEPPKVSAEAKATGIIPAYQSVGEPKQGGQISFAGEAGGIPNARQSGLVSVGEALENAYRDMGKDAPQRGQEGPPSDLSLPEGSKPQSNIPSPQIESPKGMGSLPALRPGERSIKIQQPDGTIIDAVTNDKYWEVGGERILNVGRPVEGMWSDGPLRPGEKVIEGGDVKSQTGGIGGGIAKALEKNKEAGGVRLDIAKDAIESVAKGIRWYTEPIVERLGRLGGPVSKKVSEEANQIVSQQKKYYGDLTPVLDPAKKLAAKAYRGGTTWVRGVQKVTDRAAVNNLFASNEGSVAVPKRAKAMMDSVNTANLAIGKLAEKAATGFVATGKLQRMLTNYGVDVIRRGGGKAWEAWADGIAKANKVAPADVRTFFRKWKDEIDKPGSDVAALNKINQDFVRKFPKTVTHVRPGAAWHEVVVSDPFAYLESAAQRTSAAVAFREVYKPGSGLLEKTREAVQRELSTDRSSAEFDNLMRSLQGHPLDSFTAGWNAPDTALGGAFRMGAQVVGQPLKAMVLTGNAITNLAETVVGGPAIFMGYRNVLPAMNKLGKLYPQLEMNGAVNRAMMNFAYDPTSPIRSSMRQLSNGLRKVFLEQVLNEVQEAQGAAAAKVMTDRIKKGVLSRGEKEHAVAVMRLMGMTEANARKAIAGDATLLSQFERRSSSWLSAGHQAMAERSRAGVSRLFNELFWFHTYPQTVANQLRSNLGNLVEDVGTKNWPQAWENSKLLARQLGGRTLQGALAIGIASLAYEGMSGPEERLNEAKADVGEFALQSYLSAMGGPLYVMKKALESGGDSSALQMSLGATVTPIGLGGEIIDMSNGSGKYEGRDTFERIGMFMESKTPGVRAIKSGLAMAGLREENQDLNTAMKAFYRWRRSELGYKQEISTVEGEEGNKEFRAKMRDAVKALENGKDWRKVLAESGDLDRASKSLYARTLLKTPDGKPLSAEQEQALRDKIGDRFVDLLKARDAMIRQLARELSAQRKTGKFDAEKVGQPTGEFAIDQSTDKGRQEKVTTQLNPSLQQMFTDLGLKVPTYEPKIKIGRTERLLTKEENTLLEQEVVRQYNQLLGSLDNARFRSLPFERQQQMVSERAEVARRRAEKIVRGRIAQPTR